MSRALGCALLIGSAVVGLAQANPAQLKPVPKGIFIENKGQWDSRALFQTGVDGLTYWVTRDGMVIDQHRTTTIQGKPAREGQVVRVTFENGSPGRSAGAGDTKARFDYLVGDPKNHALGVRGFREAHQQSIYPGIGVRHYFDKGSPRYDLIVAPGANPNQIRMRFDGADGLRIDGNGDLVINTRLGNIKNGKLFAYQDRGEERRRVTAEFVRLDNQRVGFKLGSFDPELPLIIDPLVYGTHFGGDPIPMQASDDKVFDIQSGREGSLYVAGFTRATLFPVTTGFYNNIVIGSTTAADAFLSKFSGDSFDLVYSVFIGGTQQDEARGLGLTPDGDFVWLAGITRSTNLPGVNNGGNAFPSYFGTLQGTQDLFFVRFRVDPDRQLVPDYVTYYGAAGRTMQLAGFDVGQASGQLIVAGNVNGGGLPGNFGNTAGTGNEGYLIFFNTTGTGVNNGVYVGGNGDDFLGDLAVDANDSAYVGGTVIFNTNQDTSITQNPRFETTPGVFENGRLLRRTDAYIRKYDSQANLVYSALIGGTSEDSQAPAAGQNPVPVYALETNTSVRVAVDQDGNAYITGIARSFDFPRTRDVFRDNFSPNPTMFVTKINSSASQILYSTGLGTTGRVFPTGIGVDARGIAVIGGVVSWDQPPLPGFPTTPGSIVITENARDDEYVGGDRTWPPPPGPPAELLSSTEAFVTYLDPNARTLLYSSYIGLDGDEEVSDVIVDRFNSAWLPGRCARSPGDVPHPFGLPASYLSADGIKLQADAGGDGFFIKLRYNLPILDFVFTQAPAIPGGLSAQTIATVQLRDPAPAGGITVQLTSDNPQAASFDPGGPNGTATVTVNEGQTVAGVAIYGLPVSASTPVKITGVLDNEFRSTVLTVNPWLTSVTLSQSSVVGGNSLTGRITLFAPAPAGGITVNLRSSSNLATVPATVQINQGETNASFAIQTRGVSGPSLVRIIGTFLGATRTANLTIVPPALRRITFNPNPVNRGEVTTLRVELDGDVGANTTVTLQQTSGPTLQGLPSQVTVPQGTRSAEVQVRAPWVTDTAQAIVRATLAGRSVQGTLVIDASLPPPQYTFEIIPNTVVGGGENTTGIITLSSPAPPGGLTLFVSSSDDTVATTPSQIVFQGGQIVREFIITTFRVNSDRTIQIRVDDGGGNRVSANLTVLQSRPVTFSVSPNVVTGGQSSTGTVTLNAPAPPGGTVVALSSNNSFAQVPASVTVLQGQISASFTITTRSVTSEQVATLTATANGGSAQATLRIVAPRLISLSFNPNQVRGGNSSTGTVTLDQPAPPDTDVVVTLQSSNSNVVQVPTTVVVLRGQRTATFTATTSRVSRGVTVEVFARIGTQQVSGFLTVQP